MKANVEKAAFLSNTQIRLAQQQFATPVFVYDQQSLEDQARATLAFPNVYGLTVRYAMKACPSGAVIRVLYRMGLHLDASSGFEAHRAIKAGVTPAHIQLTTQQLPNDFAELINQGVLFNACSLHQLRAFGQVFPGQELSIRVNPGLGSGHSNRTNVGGPSSSFGIWHEHLDAAKKTAAVHNLRIRRLHSHIGSGNNPEVWQHCARLTLGIAARLPDVHTVNLGGGHKIARMAGETPTDLQTVGQPVAEEFARFAATNNRRLHLEIEPGTYLVGNAGGLICTVVDVVNTGSDGYKFLKIDSGMTEILRPSLYGAQHPIIVVPIDDSQRGDSDYLVAGHCCESGDILTPALDNPEGLLPRRLTEAHIGDALYIGGSGAYCSAMASKNYNSFPEATEVMLARDGTYHLIRQRQTLDQILANESLPEFLCT